MTPDVLAFAIGLALLFSPQAAGALPDHGVLVPGTSLAGVRLGDTQAQVRTKWGKRSALCTVCARTTWLYTGRGSSSTGAAVTFRDGRVSAAFTLGAPRGWRTSQGLFVGSDTLHVLDVYGRLPYRRCIGYAALTMRRGNVVTSIYTTGEQVYGFGLSRPGQPVCQ